ncbi:enoyl-CoA hydratase/isomerase family protein [Eionea flava]
MPTNSSSSSNNNYDTIRYAVNGGVATLTICRPDKLNALNDNVFKEIDDCLNRLEEQVRGLIITGEGDKAFIAGADIKAMSTMSKDQAVAFSAQGHRITCRFSTLPIPVIAAVNGFALGGGFEIAMAADFIYATENAVFGLPETKLGLIPGFGGTQRLVRLVGKSKAKELVFTGRNVSLQEAESIGIVARVFSSKIELLEAAEKTIIQSAKNSPLAIAAAKQVMNQADEVSMDDGLLKEKDAFGELFSSEDMREGVNAFLEKRAAVFTGR